MAVEVGDVVKKVVWNLGKPKVVYGIVCDIEGEGENIAYIASELHYHLDNIEYVEHWHKVCKYSDNAAEVYRLDPKTVRWFKKCTRWKNNGTA